MNVFVECTAEGIEQNSIPGVLSLHTVKVVGSGLLQFHVAFSLLATVVFVLLITGNHVLMSLSCCGVAEGSIASLVGIDIFFLIHPFCAVNFVWPYCDRTLRCSLDSPAAFCCVVFMRNPVAAVFFRILRNISPALLNIN